ncbi:type II toxin-antitoxin system prevent-host-death family antitoxin [Longimycelium tulufanense]|nr:type II toxin-antitoxin system prevent-host-death family antitoxin [Longimycelium tulufanense]
MTAETHAGDVSGEIEIPLSDARDRLADLVDAAKHGTFVYLTRRGQRVAALVAADVAERYEQIEDDYWARRANDARQRLAAGEDDVISFERLLAETEGPQR